MPDCPQLGQVASRRGPVGSWTVPGLSGLDSSKARPKANTNWQDGQCTCR